MNIFKKFPWLGNVLFGVGFFVLLAIEYAVIKQFEGPGEEQGFLVNVARFFQTGGPFMWAILAMGNLGLAIFIERLLVLNFRSRVNAPALWGRVKSLINQGDMAEAKKVCQQSDRPLFRIFLSGLFALDSKKETETDQVWEVKNNIEESMLELLPIMERRTHYIAAIANVATLLGLLGTIFGLIASFESVSAEGVSPEMKAKLLAQGIAVAMNTTAFGLIVAIPLLLVYSIIQAQTTRIMSDIDEYATKLQNHLIRFIKSRHEKAAKSSAARYADAEPSESASTPSF